MRSKGLFKVILFIGIAVIFGLIIIGVVFVRKGQFNKEKASIATDEPIYPIIAAQQPSPTPLLTPILISETKNEDIATYEVKSVDKVVEGIESIREMWLGEDLKGDLNIYIRDVKGKGEYFSQNEDEKTGFVVNYSKDSDKRIHKLTGDAYKMIGNDYARGRNIAYGDLLYRTQKLSQDKIKIICTKSDGTEVKSVVLSGSELDERYNKLSSMAVETIKSEEEVYISYTIRGNSGFKLLNLETKQVEDVFESGRIKVWEWNLDDNYIYGQATGSYGEDDNTYLFENEMYYMQSRKTGELYSFGEDKSRDKFVSCYDGRMYMFSAHDGTSIYEGNPEEETYQVIGEIQDKKWYADYYPVGFHVFDEENIGILYSSGYKKDSLTEDGRYYNSYFDEDPFCLEDLTLVTYTKQ